MQQIEQKACDNLKQIFYEANIYLEAFFKGQQDQTKENLILFSNTREDNKNKGIPSNLKGEDGMSTIRIRKDGRYELRFYYKNKQYSVYDTNVSNLRKKKTNKLKELKEQTRQVVIKQKDTYTLKQWFNIWLETYKKPFIKEDSAFNIKSYFDNHILKVFGNYYINQITITDLQSFLNNLPKNRTKELIITYFNACLQKQMTLIT